jgi:hypothetical protein
MKIQKIKIFFLIAIIIPNLSLASIGNLSINDLMFKSAITLEHQTSDFSENRNSNNFKRTNFEKNLKNFDNVTIGLHLRPIKYLGFNANFTKFTMKSENIAGHNLQSKSSAKINMVDFSALFYISILGDGLLDLFLEAGISDINNNSKLNFTTGFEDYKNHETAILYGIGLQFDPYILDLAIRASFQERKTTLYIIDSNIRTFRLGIVKYF